MREIIFRGKKKYGKDNGKWVYGSLIQDGNGDCSIWSNELVDDVAVDKETLGQFTGIIDKNENKIFEGDIVQEVSWPRHKGVVKFMRGTFDSGIYEYYGWVVQEEDGNIDHTPLLQGNESDGYYDGFEVCGNIFDNSELLKEVEQ